MKVQPIGEPHNGRQAFTFHCPGCAEYDSLSAPHVFDDSWTYNGDGDKPTVNPSILVTGHQGRLCHSFVREGRIEFLSDCTHSLAGKTVELPEV